MDRSDLPRTLRQVNGRSKLNVDLSGVQKDTEALRTEFEVRYITLSNVVTDNAGDIAALAQEIEELKVLPDWVEPVQSNVDLGGFGGDLALSRVRLPPVVENSVLAQTGETSINVTITVRLRAAAQLINPSWTKET